MKKITYQIVILFSFFLSFALAAEIEAPTPTLTTEQPDASAFIKAYYTQDHILKAALMEEFIRTYPSSNLRRNALGEALVAYQQAGLKDNVEKTAEAILLLDNDNLFVLSILTNIQRVKAINGDQEAARKAPANGRKGLKILSGWQKPEVMSQSEYEKLQRQITATFAGAAAFGAQKSNDYATARKYYNIAVKAAPDSLADYYQLAVVSLDLPVPDVSGFWYLARANYLAGVQNNSAVQQKIASSGKTRYRKYHGSDEGWDQLLASTAMQTEPPEGFTIKPLPSPCEQAVNTVREADLVRLTFNDWKLVLSQRDCSPEAGMAAQKVWQFIQKKQNNGSNKLVIPAKIISATNETVMAAVTQEGRHNNIGELQVVLSAKQQNIPAVYADVELVGIISEYTAEPFIMKMTDVKFR